MQWNTFCQFRNAGRPSKVLSKERLGGLLRLKILVSRIAEDLQVSRPTVYKAMAEYNLQETRYSDISVADIQHAVSSIKGNHPNAGEVMLQGHLKAQFKESMFSAAKYARLYMT